MRRYHDLASSSPYQPGTPLTGGFAIDLGQETEINRLVIHDGIWNGAQILYPATQLRVRCATGDKWHELGSLEQFGEQPYALAITFRALTVRRIEVVVGRPKGGRTAVREIEAYRVADAELIRVARLRAEMITERWHDVVLISHGSPQPTQYGNCSFDGQLAVLRYGEDGQLGRASLIRTGTLAEGSKRLFGTNESRDWISAIWLGDQLQLEGPACRGLSIATGRATAIAVEGETLPCVPSTLATIPAQGDTTLSITDVAVQHHPPQKGLVGGQPWAVVTWQTDTPATSQVECQTADGPLRRTPLSSELTCSHRCRVDFLRQDYAYEFTAVSVLPSGAPRVHRPPGRADAAAAATATVGYPDTIGLRRLKMKEELLVEDIIAFFIPAAIL
jgi:hypothetical protein